MLSVSGARMSYRPNHFPRPPGGHRNQFFPSPQNEFQPNDHFNPRAPNHFNGGRPRFHNHGNRRFQQDGFGPRPKIGKRYQNQEDNSNQPKRPKLASQSERRLNSDPRIRPPSHLKEAPKIVTPSPPPNIQNPSPPNRPKPEPSTQESASLVNNAIPTSSSTSGAKDLPAPVPATQNAPEKTEAFFCRLCNNNKPIRSEKDFVLHLTFIHYQERIMKRIQPPFKCLKCGYSPGESESVNQKREDLLMHYGSYEGVSMQYYKLDCANIPDIPEKPRETQLSPMVSPAHVCEICNASHDNERLFIRHISLRHFSRELCEELPKSVPFKCPYIDCNQEKTNLHHLMMHYGCEHNVSMELYLKRQVKASGNQPTSSSKEAPPVQDLSSPTVSESGQNVVDKPLSKFSESPDPEKGMATNLGSGASKKSTTYLCTVCKDKRTFITQKSLNYHLMLVHFFPNLPKAGPYDCNQCDGKFSERNLFARHFLEAHFETYLLEFKANGNKPPRATGLALKMKSKSNSDKSDRSDHVSTSSDGKESSSMKPQNKHSSARKNPSQSFEDALGSPQSPGEAKTETQGPRVRKTVHNMSTARQRLVKNWEKSSFDAHNSKIEELEADIEALKESHKEAMNAKVCEFERWIQKKETALEEEEKCRKSVEEKLEQANVDVVDLQKQLEQAQANCSTLETIVADKLSVNSKISKEKKTLEKTLKTLQDEMSSLKEEEKATKAQLEEETEKTKAKEMSLSEKEEELKELNLAKERDLAEFEKKRVRLERQCEAQKTKVEKLMLEKKERVQEEKELAKKQKDLEKDLQEQIARLTKENRQLTLKTAQEKQVESTTLSKVEEITQLLKNSESQVELLETERNVLLESLERLQKILNDFESIVDEKNEKIKELNARLEDNETNLEEAMQKIKDQKGIDREKRDLHRQIKQLQSTLKDWESRQFNNLKLIDGLQKENTELKVRIKNFDENNSGAEEELSHLKSAFKAKERDLNNVKQQLNELEKDKAKMEARMRSKSDEVFSLQNRNDALDTQVRDLEREIRNTAAASANQANIDDLRQELSNQEGELRHLRMTLMNVKSQYNDQKAENVKLKELVENAKARNDTFESDYSKLVTEHATITSVLKHKNRAQLTGVKTLDPMGVDSTISVKVEPLDNLEDLDDLSDFESLPGASRVDTSKTILFDVPAVIDKVPPLSKSQPNKVFNAAAPLVRGSASPDLEVFFPESQANLPPLSFISDPSKISSKRPSKSVKVANSKKAPKKKKSSSVLVDVTAAYDDRDDIVCGICEQFDPPVSPENSGDKRKRAKYTTEWVGCDCDRWFHRLCTKLSRVSDKFSCRSVKMKCLKPGSAPSANATGKGANSSSSSVPGSAVFDSVELLP